MEEEIIDIAFIVETRMKDHAHIKNLLLEVPYGKGNAGGNIGGMIAISRIPLKIKIKTLEVAKDNWWTILQIDQDIYGICYFPPSIQFKRSYTDFYDHLRTHSDNWNRRILVVGDFNSRHTEFGDHSNNTRGVEFTILLQEQVLSFCKPTEGKYTTKNHLGKGITDLLLISEYDIVEDLRVHESKSLGGSDHRPLTWTGTLMYLQPQNRKKMWNIMNFIKNEDCVKEYQRSLDNNQLSLDERNIKEAIDKNWDNFELWINKALKESCGYKKEINWSTSNWWTPELRNQSREIDDYVNSGELNQTDREIFKRYRANWRNRKEKLLRDRLDDLCNRGKKNEFFKYVKKLSFYGKKKTSALDKGKISEYENYFMNTFGGTPTGNRSLYDEQVLESSKVENETIYEGEEEITEEEIEKAISKLGRGKAPGLDKLPAEIYLYGGKAIVEILYRIFNQMWRISYTPRAWNKALVCLIYKNKGEVDNIANYRPISLTIVAKRLLEIIIDGRLTEFKSKVHDYQAGFRPKRSTVDQIYCLQEIYELNKKMKKNTISIFLDLRAAYDCVDRNILWTRLSNKYKVPIRMIQLIRSLFDCNSSHLLVEDSIAEEGIKNRRGVPQGSSLSPIMFNFYIDGLIEELHEQKEEDSPSSCLFFADDGNLHGTNKKNMQELLDICDRWSQNHGISFAPEKCLVVARGKIQLKIGQSILPQVESAKYLGIPFGAKGPMWNKVITDGSKKAKGVIMMLSKLGFNSKMWDPSSSIKVYKLFVRPIMEYAQQSTLLGKKELELIQRNQFLALRIIFGVPWNTSKTAMVKLACLESAKCRNLLLNASFVNDRLYQEENSNPTTVRMKELEKKQGSLIRFWLQENDLIARLRGAQKVRTEKVKIKYKDISESNFGATRISNGIMVKKNLKHSTILRWKDAEDAKIKRNIIRWRLGRIAYHQQCKNCNEAAELSRKHALECSRTNQSIKDIFHEINQEEESLSLDTVLNHYISNTSESIFRSLDMIINTITSLCHGILL